MKKLFITLFVISYSHIAFSATVTAVNNKGTWSTGSTWNSGSVPTNGDIAVIPAGDTVVVNKNVDDAGKNIQVVVLGALAFTGDAQLKLSNLSSITILATGTVYSTTGSSKQSILMGTNPVYSGTIGSAKGIQFASAYTSALTGSGFSSLPVKFIGFSLTAEKDAIKIGWVTAEEVEVSYYEIERSTDGHSWNNIARLYPIGNARQLSEYSYLDRENIAVQAYYRIKEVDKNGAATYTAIKSGFIAGSGNDIAIRSIGSGNIVIHFHRPSDRNFIVRVINYGGQVLKQLALNNPAGDVTIPTSLHGGFIVQVSNGKDAPVARQLIL